MPPYWKFKLLPMEELKYMKLYETIMRLFQYDFELVIAFLGLVLFVILLTEWIERNNYKLELKRQVSTPIEARINKFRMASVFNFATISYVMHIEYEVEGETKKKRIRTFGKFALKYKDKDSIQIVLIPGSDMVFFYEETWKEINRHITFLACEISFVLVLILISAIRACP